MIPSPLVSGVVFLGFLESKNKLLSIIGWVLNLQSLLTIEEVSITDEIDGGQITLQLNYTSLDLARINSSSR